MRKMTIFQVIRDENNHAKIVGRKTLRSVNLHPSFEGFGEKGAINKDACKKLADDLEPYNEGWEIL